jgi:nucleotide-binding universal stress UspA family protein
MRALVIYDGTLQAKEVLRYGLRAVKEKGGDIICLSVVNTPLFIGYDSIAGASEIARRELDKYIEDAKAIIREEGQGVRTKIVVEEGNPEEEIVNYLAERYIDMLIYPPRYNSLIKKYDRFLKENGKIITEDRLMAGVAAIAIKAV